MTEGSDRQAMSLRPPLERPLLIYDGECGFCARWTARWKALAGERLEAASFQSLADSGPEVPLERFRAAVHLLHPDGRVVSGAEAVFSLFALFPQYRWLLWLYRNLPGARRLSERGYRFVAGHRRGFDRLDAWLWGRRYVGAGHRLSRRLFLRLLGVVYLCAFLSLWTQHPGLFGARGILPVEDFLAGLAENYGARAPLLAPSLFWLAAGDAALAASLIAGVFCSLLVIACLAPRYALLALWLLYLSWVNVGQDFLSFQWDALLLEVGFLAVFLAPGGWRTELRRDRPPSQLALWLLRWTLFRLMLSSGLVKLASGDPTWRDLSALTFHHQTQPLPTALAWHMHALPERLHALCAAGMFGVELLVPLLILAPRRPRMAAAAVIAAFQALIALSGNYGYFNLLFVALCVLLLDDAALARFALRRQILGAVWQPASGRRAALAGPAALVFALLGATLLARQALPAHHLPDWALAPARWSAPLRLCNAYGLFAVMTTRRLEIALEGSYDRQTWRSYEFRHKPGDPMRAPAWVAPHMPRLDWQMWFAALGPYPRYPWFLRLCQRLLEGEPSVVALLEENPFPHGPPRHLRAVLYEYSFTAPRERARTGAWWKRERLGLYAPEMELWMFRDTPRYRIVQARGHEGEARAGRRRNYELEAALSRSSSARCLPTSFTKVPNRGPRSCPNSTS